MKNILEIIILTILLFFGNYLFAQDRIIEIEKNLNELAKSEQTLNNKVDISVTDVALQEFLRSIAVSNNLNLSIDPNLNIPIVNNFSNVNVIDVLVFLCKKYDLTLDLTGNIISIEKFIKKEEQKKIVQKIKTKVNYNKATDLLSIDIKNDSLINVIKEINNKTGKNLVCAKGIEYITVNSYIKEMPFDNAVDKFGFSNNFIITKTEDDFYLIENKISDQITDNKHKSSRNKKNNDKTYSTDASIEATDINNISVSGTDVPIKDLILEVSDKLKINFFFISDIQGTSTLNVQKINFDNLLDYLFNGTVYTYKKQSDYYIIGDGIVGNLEYFKVVELQFRTVDKITEVIPGDLKKDLELIEFNELNSIMISGNPVKVKKLENFLRGIDKVVPLVFIEVIIVDINSNHIVSTGISAGLSDSVPKSSGSVFPYLDMSLNSKSVNNVITSINGLNWINFGQVTPNFYVNLKALETNGNLKIRSTPKLATLNGHQALFTSGETKYYKEEKDNLFGYQNPSLVTTHIWRAINADLAITITPVVSGDEQITLDIDVKQSEFTPREFEDSPPGSVTRQFTSLIRVKNGEMIMLGGLEKNTTSNTGSGIPILSRIPILKWIFSERTNSKYKSKLNIFIKPTVIY